jgi:hypothetical protein
MVAVNKVIFSVICIFFIIFYFFLLPLPKVIVKYETYVQKQIALKSIKEENSKIEQYIAQLDNKNIDPLKYILNEKSENEIYIKFLEGKKEIPIYSFNGKAILSLLYYLFGITIFSIIFINLITSQEQVYRHLGQKKKSKYYLNQN